VINVYLTDIVPTHARPAETAARLDRILDHFGAMHLRQVTGRACRAYVATRTSPNAARRELEDLRAALNHFRKEGYCLAVPAITLPEKPPARERWLTRGEAARLVWALWRMRQKWKGIDSDRRTGRHVARFVLVALYTGTRSAAICAAAMRPTPGSGYVDLERGVFYRRAPGSRQTKKRQPPVPIPPRLLAHLRRWQRLGLSKDHIVEWNGKPVKSVRKALRAGRIAADLGDDVTAHTLRHTAPTWAMQNGADLWQAAGYFGMTVETLERVYGHHHPDYLSDAVAAISAPQKPHRKGGNKRERTPANVIRMTGS
jgi:integrase